MYTAPDRAGQGSCTLIVSDIDDIAQKLRTSGLAKNAEPARSDRVDTVMVKDPRRQLDCVRGTERFDARSLNQRREWQ